MRRKKIFNSIDLLRQRQSPSFPLLFWKTQYLSIYIVQKMLSINMIPFSVALWIVVSSINIPVSDKHRSQTYELLTSNGTTLAQAGTHSNVVASNTMMMSNTNNNTNSGSKTKIAGRSDPKASSDNSDSSGSSLSVGAIAGIVVGVILFIAIGIGTLIALRCMLDVLCCCCWH